MNRRRHTQTLTYWAPQAENRFGEEGFAAPVAIEGRWENRQERVTIPTGEEIISKAFAYSDIVLAIGGFVAPGSHVGQANPALIATAEQIKGNTEVTSLRTNTLVRAAIL